MVLFFEKELLAFLPMTAGPLAGLKILEIADAGPVPFAAMLLADMGADVLRIERPGAARDGAEWVTLRGRPSLTLDLKDKGDMARLLRLAGKADALMEGFRPGVMERLGLGPEVVLGIQPRIVYGRATGWGQTGPLRAAPGHDINYIAITGVLAALGFPGAPPPVPLNILGDFAGGAMFLLVGVLAALLEAKASGKGQVVDSSMSEGASLLAAFMHYMRAAGRWQGGRRENLLDGGAPFYNVYQCADGKYLAVGAIEPQFYAALRQACGLNDSLFDDQHDRSRWTARTEYLATFFRGRTRDEWCAQLEGTDACVSPVLDWDEAPMHPHNVARAAFLDDRGATHPAAAPRFSRTPACVQLDRHSLTAADAFGSWGITDSGAG